MYTLATNYPKGATAMVAKRKPGQKGGKVKVGKLKLNKETVKDLTDSTK